MSNDGLFTIIVIICKIAEAKTHLNNLYKFIAVVQLTFRLDYRYS